jgi:hypothetical protein
MGVSRKGYVSDGGWRCRTRVSIESMEDGTLKVHERGAKRYQAAVTDSG